MLSGPCFFGRSVEDENADSGAETAGSDCSKMSHSSIDVTAHDPPLVAMHLLANPGDSLLLQHTLDCLLEWVCPGLRLFHVSERACPVREPALAHPRAPAGHPSLAVTLFLHESCGEERILRVLDFLQRPPWRYHHTESGLLRPYLLPERDFYGLGAGMPVWAVRPVHCGAEVLRLTLHSAHENFEDAVRLYQTVLRARAEGQRAGFRWFTLMAERTFSLQLALKRLEPGVRVEACHSAVLQFEVGEIGQLVPLMPNPCSPISATRWQTEDLDGNKILFQVNGGAQAPRLFSSAFPLSCPTLPPPSLLKCPVPASPDTRLCQLKERALLSLPGAPRRGAGTESLGSGSACSTPPGSSCYSSQRSSPASAFVNTSESRLPPDRERPETDVDTGRAVNLPGPGLDTLAGDLSRCTLGGSEGKITERNHQHPAAQSRASRRHSRERGQTDEFFI